MPGRCQPSTFRKKNKVHTVYMIIQVVYPVSGPHCSHTCCHINSHNQVRGHRTGSIHSGEEYRREKTQTSRRWYTHSLSQLTQFMPPPETYTSEIGSQPTMCQVHTSAYVSLLAPVKTDCTACHPRKTYHVLAFGTHAGCCLLTPAT